MNKAHMNIEYLNEVINSTIDAIEKGQKEIFNIFEYAKQECERMERELEDLKAQVKDRIKEVDNLVKLEKAANNDSKPGL